MKILFVIKTLVHAKGGAEKVLTMVASELAKNPKLNVRILTFDKNGEKLAYPVAKNVEIIYLNSGEPGKKSETKETLIRMIQLRRTIVKIRPAIVIPFMISSFVPVSLALIFSGIPILASEHSSFNHYKSLRMLMAYIASIFFIKKITCPSDQVRSAYPWIIRKKMYPITNPVETGTLPMPKQQFNKKMFFKRGTFK